MQRRNKSRLKMMCTFTVPILEIKIIYTLVFLPFWAQRQTSRHTYLHKKLFSNFISSIVPVLAVQICIFRFTLRLVHLRIR
jgi:hypothetical protein